jgi:hypothetical protein
VASVNVSEDEFFDVANAANRAQDAGDRELARRLDKLARKMNAALSARNTYNLVGNLGRSLRSKILNWKDVPTTLLKP